MPRPVHLAICLLVAPAVLASGCGSTESASTSNTARTATSAGASSRTTPQTATQSTGSTGARHALRAREDLKTKRELQEKVAKARRELEHGNVKKAPEAAKPKLSPRFASEVPKARRFPPEIYEPFLTACHAGKGSIAGCECILVKLELSNGEKDRHIAELLTVQLAARQGASVAKIMAGGVVLPAGAQRAAGECKSV
jgi:hypothetical protein